MELDEAVAIQQHILHGNTGAVQKKERERAARVIHTHSRVFEAQMAMNRGGEVRMERINVVQRERLNMILSFRLAQACGKFTDWAST